ncbi:hypothetical protein HBI80_015720 [Parastagonospora nodorum]|nr:hypothetical protein HBI80_015720 [Parastagonospora nodorum]
MQIDTTDAIFKALAAANKLVAPRSYVLGGVDYQETFVIVCSFRKVDKHVFRAYNTISVTAQRTIIRKGSPYGRTVFNEFHNCKLEGTIIAKDSVTGDCIYKIEDARNMIANVKHDASKHESSYEYKELISQGAAVAQRFMLKRILKTRDLDFLPYFQSCLCLDFLSTVQNAEQQCRDILEKEGLNKSEASRRFKTYSSCKVKRFTLNSVKDLFTNSSKDYFLSIAAEDAAKAANTSLPPKEVRAKILIESYKPIKFSDKSVLVMQGGMTQDSDRPWIIVASIAFAEAITLTEATHVLAEICVGIVYFNPDSKLELKVLSKQDVKTTS